MNPDIEKQLNKAKKEKQKEDNKKRDMIFLKLLSDAGLPRPAAEFKFHKDRLWRFDWCYVDIKLAIEVEGAIYGRPVICNHCNRQVTGNYTDKKGKRQTYNITEGGGHSSGKAVERDHEKFNHAAIYGWKILRFNSTKIHEKETIDLIKKAFENKEINYTINEELF